MKQPLRLKGTWGQGRKHTNLPESLFDYQSASPALGGQRNQTVCYHANLQNTSTELLFGHLLDKGEKAESAVPCYLLQRRSIVFPGHASEGSLQY